jgi:glyoxylase-like metal-dependent hydrolase (beta-lactamase superfamily II)
VARDVLDRCLREIGYGFGDVRRFLVTHVHRDHYTLASVLGRENGADVALGIGEKPALDLLNDEAALAAYPFLDALRDAGADELAEEWATVPQEAPDPTWWRYPTTWLERDQVVEVGARSLDAVHTPGHTPGHYVFADRAAGLLFAGDHVLPTITPSIGFTLPPAPHPLGDFMASLTKVRSLPDLTVLPAHGPVAPSSHARVDELLEHHEDRLALSLAALAGGPRTAHEVARRLPWTRHEHAFDDLDAFARGLATMETKAHLELLVAQGRAAAELGSGAVRYAAGRGAPA